MIFHQPMVLYIAAVKEYHDMGIHYLSHEIYHREVANNHHTSPCSTLPLRREQMMCSLCWLRSDDSTRAIRVIIYISWQRIIFSLSIIHFLISTFIMLFPASLNCHRMITVRADDGFPYFFCISFFHMPSTRFEAQENTFFELRDPYWQISVFLVQAPWAILPRPVPRDWTWRLLFSKKIRELSMLIFKTSKELWPQDI